MRVDKKSVWGWMLYDWASQPFFTLIVTFTFAPYFVASVAETPAKGQEMWGYATAAAMAVIALSAPLLGALADAMGPRKPWVAGFSVFFILGSAALWMASPGLSDPTWILIAFAVGLIGAEFTAIFTNSLLPTLGPKEEVGRISGSGWAMGYWGGLVSLGIVLCLLAPIPGEEVTVIGLAPIFGLDPAAGEGARATGPLSAIWYLIFIIPFFLWTKDAPRVPRAGPALSAGLRSLRRMLTSLPRRPSLSAYLAASMFYRDALGGLYTFGGIYAAGVLGWGAFQLGIFGIIAAATGAVGAWLGGKADRAFGPKPVILTAIIALTAVSALAISTGPDEALFLTLAEGSPWPTYTFLFCGAVIGAAGGSLQAASRTLLIAQAEEGRMGEAFGVYALAGKATSFLAPFAIAVVTGLTESQRLGVTPVIVLFLIGFILMRWVRPDGDRLNA